MAFTAETWIISALALIVSIVLGLVISVWRGLLLRRALSITENRLQEREDELHTLLETNRHLVQENYQRDLKLASMDSNFSNLRQRQEDQADHYARLEDDHHQLTQHKGQLTDELARARADVRGLSVEVEQTRHQLQEKMLELDNLKTQLLEMGDRCSQLLKDKTELETRHLEREDHHVQQVQLLTETRENVKQEFENLANKIFEDKGKNFTTTSQASREALLLPFREQIAGFQSRINEVHSESVKGQTALEHEIKKVLEVGLEMNTQATNLTSALKGDKKTAGNWGEAQLQRTLELAGLEPGDHYQPQAAFDDDTGKRKLPDFIVKLPDSKHLVIDSKVSLVDYDRAIAAETEAEQQDALNAHAMAVRNHIRDLAAKDYASLPGIGSPDFVLMFMPVEPAYIEAMRHNKELFNYGYQQGVIMVSHTTLMPILRTVANLWMVDKNNKEAREISGRAGEIFKQVCVVAQRLSRLGQTLKAASNHYNETVTGLVGKQGLHGKLERFQQLSARSSVEVAALEPLHTDLDLDRLSPLVENEATELKTPDNEADKSTLRTIKTEQ